MARNPIVVDGGGPALTPEQIKSQAATVSAAAQKASIDKKVKSIGGSKEAQELVRQILTEQANADAAWAAAGGTEGIIQGLSGLGTVGGAAKSPVAASGGLTKADIDAAVATANAANATVIKQLQTQLSQIQAQQQSEKIASRVKAKDKLTAMLAGWNLQGLATYVDKQITDDVSEEMILLGVYDQPEYKTRFPGMEGLRKAGRTISEDEYIRIENAMTQTARFFDVPKGWYDTPDDFGNLIAKNVSAKEYQDRLQIGQDLARSLNPEVKTQLLELYNVSEGDLTAYVLDPDKALPLIQKQAKAAMFVGLGRAAGFNLPGISATQAENIVATEPYAKLSEAQLKQSLGQAGVLRKEQQRLSQIEGMTYNEQEALNAVIESNPQALLASQQRAQREVSRFRSRGGITGSSLGTQINV
jgi:hypothetical protein